MFIALSGAQCVGKTSLLNRLKEMDEDKGWCFDYKKEVVRKIVKEFKISVNDDGDNMTQFLIMYSHYKIASESEYRYIVTDRCALDCHAYSTYLYRHGKISKFAYDESSDMLKNLKDKYNVIFYIAPEFDIVDDGFRSLDLKFQTDIHNIFLEIIKEYDLTNIVYIKGSVEERIDTISKWIIDYSF